MSDDRTTVLQPRLGQLITALLSSPWVEALTELWKLWRKLASGLAEEGMYEVLEYESTLELLDERGERARFHKREKVRYLQNQTIAYQDQAWADGDILLDYRCAPGVPVDRYRPGQKTYILIALHGVKSRGDVDEFNIEWATRRSFLRATEQWETEISHRTRKAKVQIVFPAGRPPLRVSFSKGMSGRETVLAEDAQVRLPDGRHAVTWESDRPQLYERYVLKWDW